MTRKLYIETVGCQMNMLDSELVVADLRHRGYEMTADPLAADLVLFNTCSIRSHAEEKIYSNLGRLKIHKQQHPEKIIGVIGCMAQNHQKIVFDRAPYVDLVVGPGQLHQIPALVDQIKAGAGRQMEVSLDRKEGARRDVERSFESYDPLRDESMRPSRYQAFVRIMIGCDKFCTYCIVPKVRGPEQSRPAAQILSEVRKLADEGCREITLLGQTVNSYRHTADGRTTRLSDLLLQLSEVSGIDRLRFVTSFPNDMTQDLLEAVRDIKKCSHYLHVPAQSGSNEVLKRMKRNYTVEQYREMMCRIRETIPDSSVTSDFIVGFCGETEEDFQKTMDLVAEQRFKNSYIFKYSPREGTKADDLWPDDVPEEVKRRRNVELLEVQNKNSYEDNQPFIGRDVEILVEGPSRKHVRGEAQQDATSPSALPLTKSSAKPQAEDEAVQSHDDGDHDHHHGPLQLVGRTNCDRIVVFDGNPRQIGRFLPVTIYDANSFTLFGEVKTEHVVPEVYSLSI
ncbi:MAG: tRNA (N6-isopentenyl adenosine(37)-C2)-methylthiotransferase MiaB [Planctomycetia bacterium]|nr:tRNA (N6-isopentenyl adenosine(37)-C2)-methylthiotransferase MiaB [Planctomycetia bacterium]